MITIAVDHVRVTARDVRLMEHELEPDLDRRAFRVQMALLRGVPKRTSRLASTIRKNPGRTALGPYRDVIVGRSGMTDYLGYILNGTPPHLIAAINNRPNPHLRFMIGGVVVFAKVVRHPGTRPNNFMLRALPVALQ